ncbi:hypothetical protein BASA81_002125 [Batrachochytrium salamandrivorans]|nr:hypothetical protein BASA81_002125 [Batrachochytrium salamandrivorans]
MSYFLHDLDAIERGQEEITLDISTYSREEIALLWRGLGRTQTQRLTVYSLKSPGNLLPSAAPTSTCSLSSLISSSSCHEHAVVLEEGEEQTMPLLSPVLLHGRITYLDLSSNLLDHRYVQDLAIGLASNRTLVSLDLGYNVLGDLGARVLAHSVLKCNTSLQVLILVGNHLTDSGADELVEGLQFNASLRGLYVLGNRISPRALGRVEHALHLARCRAAVLALRTAQEVPKSGLRSQIKRLPRDLVRLVFTSLTGKTAAIKN